MDKLIEVNLNLEINTDHFSFIGSSFWQMIKLRNLFLMRAKQTMKITQKQKNNEKSVKIFSQLLCEVYGCHPLYYSYKH